MIGLGRMGSNLVRRLMLDGHECVVYDLNPATVQALQGEGAAGASSLDDFVERLSPPRVAWMMVPAAFVGVGTMGGVFGLDRGFCMMIGGDDETVAHLDPIFRTLAPGVDSAPRTPGATGEPSEAEHGYLHCGPNGAGHFVKMDHNGIEYGMMAAFAEGFNI